MTALEFPDISRRVETDRPGPFVFQLGVDVAELTLPMQRVEDAHARFRASPLAEVANKLERDIWKLLTNLVEWHAELVEADVPPLIRAPLVHYYYELIHPFWDGNGRVGRVLEATILQAAGYEYAPFALARFYLDEIDTYFSLFNTCRKAAERHRPHANTRVVAFHQEGMLVTINALHDRVNRLVGLLLFQSRCRELLDAGTINARQYTIVSQLLAQGQPQSMDEVRHAPWYASLYLKLTDKTRGRDLKKLRELELVFLDSENKLWPGCVRPPNIRAR